MKPGKISRRKVMDMLKRYISLITALIVFLSCCVESDIMAENIFLSDFFTETEESTVADESVANEITKLTPLTGYPPYNPPAGEHPRLFFRKQDTAELI